MVKCWFQPKQVVIDTMLGKIMRNDMLLISNPNFVTLLDLLIEEASERNHYANNFLDYSFNYKDNRDFKKIIYCHPDSINFLVHINTYDVKETTLESKSGDIIKIKYDRTIPLNIMKFVDGLYTNEIILIEMSEIK